MWISFVIISILALAMVYSVGYVLLRTLSFARVDAFLFAPLFSAAIFSLMGLALSFVGVQANWLTVFVVPLLVVVAIFAAKAILAAKTALGKRRSADADPRASITLFEHATVKGLLIVAAAGILVSVVAFLDPLTVPDSVSSQWDNGLHINLPVAMLESGKWSFLEVSQFANYASAPEMYFETSPGFYPNAFHVLVALVMSFSGVSVAFAINVVLFLFAGIVYPLAMYGLLTLLFKDKPFIAVAGGALAMLLEAFPWGLIECGPLYPNELSYAVLPLVLALFIALFELPHPKTVLIKLIALLCFGCVSLALLQPNATFAAVVFLYPYCCVKIYCFAKERAKNHPLVIPLAACVAWSVFCALVWFAIYKSPITPEFNWAQSMPLLDAVKQCFTLGLRIQDPEYLLALLLVMGMVSCIKNKRRRWLIFAWLGAGLLFVLSAGTESYLKRVLTLFWYTDQYRLAANVAMFSVPLIAEGVLFITEIVQAYFPDFAERYSPAQQSFGIVLIVGFVVAVLFPLILQQGPVGYFRHSVYTKNSLSYYEDYDGTSIYTARERAFVNKVTERIGDEHVLNCPYDGSIYAYGLDGINTCYRSFGTNEESTLPEIVLRLGLADYTEDEDVREALALVQVKYLLVLDSPACPNYATFYYGGGSFIDTYAGFLAVTDDTPGFTVVLAEHDMRLYRIDGVE